jgi:hypothetical protein
MNMRVLFKYAPTLYNDNPNIKYHRVRVRRSTESFVGFVQQTVHCALGGIRIAFTIFELVAIDRGESVHLKEQQPNSNVQVLFLKLSRGEYAGKYCTSHGSEYRRMRST